jgi:hypothetical protein
LGESKILQRLRAWKNIVIPHPANYAGFGIAEKIRKEREFGISEKQNAKKKAVQVAKC